MENEELKLAKDRAYAIVEKLNNDLEKKIITEEEWFKKNKEIFTKQYLSADDPRAQSGHGGDEFHYANTHSLILQAINRNGTFIDVGCANGYLIESLKKWTANFAIISLTGCAQGK